MARIYVKKIRAGQMQLSDVPARWRAEVEAMLDADNN